MRFPVKPVRGAVLVALLAVFVSCNIHEWPASPVFEEPYGLNLVFDTDLPLWDPQTEAPAKSGSAYAVKRGYMRYIVRAYPMQGGAPAPEWSEEFIFTREISQGYDCKLTLALPTGSYRLLVWADLTGEKDAAAYYDADDFEAIRLQGTHTGATDHRDAFFGSLDVDVVTYTGAHLTPSGVVEMQRPLAKFEFVTTDLASFLKKEAARMGARATSAETFFDDYEVVISYDGYMPSVYSLITGNPMDSSTGVQFRSSMRQLNDNEASLGFDYVFVSDLETSVTVRVSLFDKATGAKLSQTAPVKVPLLRGRHTVVRGSYLLENASGGVGIDPGYEGDNDIPFEF